MDKENKFKNSGNLKYNSKDLVNHVLSSFEISDNIICLLIQHFTNQKMVEI